MPRRNESKREEAQRKRGGGPFVALTRHVLCSDEFALLSAHETKLLFDLLSQYNGNNNGDLAASFEKVMRGRGWKSKDTLNKAMNGLKRKGFVTVTRQGGIHQCSLYAVTFLAIDECGGKLEVSKTRHPPGGWQKQPFLLQTRYNASTPAVPKHQ